jgi:uncharacterized membrane protein
MSANMSPITTSPELLQGERRTRRFTLISVALNLFFIGLAIAFFARSYFAPPSVITVNIDRGAAARIERIAATLPPADAEIMRAAYRDNAATLDAARKEVDDDVALIKASFRADPYDVEATRRAMAETRAKYQQFLAKLHDAIAGAAGKMSPAGRTRLAEYSSTRVNITVDR